MMKSIKNVWNALHSKTASYVFFALSSAAAAFFASATWTYGWMAEIYPLGDKFMPVFLSVVAVISLLNLAFLFAVIFKKSLSENTALRVIHTVLEVLSIAVFLYTLVLVFGFDTGIKLEGIINGLNYLKGNLGLLGLALLLPLAGMFPETPKKAGMAMVAALVVAAIVAVPLAVNFEKTEIGGKSKLPEIPFMSENVLKDAVISGEMLKKGEKPDAANLLEDNDKCWTPQNPNRAPAEGSPNITGSYAEIKMPEKRTFNTALIEESGNQVQYFRLQALVDGEWVTFYQSEKIQDQRLCSFDPVTTDTVRLCIDKFRNAETPARIKSVKLFNEPKRSAENFEAAVYQRIDGDVPTEILAKGEDYVKNYARFYDVYSTVIIFGAVHWDENGKMNFGSLTEEEFAAEINAFKQIVGARSNKSHSVKIIITTLADGAWGSSVNEYMTKYWESIADQTAEFIDKYNFDGADIDWEYPQTKDDWAVYDKFIARLDEKMAKDGENRILSAALSAWGLGMTEETLGRFDQIQFMAYDGNDKDGFQSGLQQAQDGLRDFVNNGADISKINIGIAAYGRPLNNAPYWATWRDLKTANYWDSKYYNIPDAGQIYDGTFCSPATAGDKTAYALFSGVGGVMVFRAGCDKTMDDPNSVACGIENTLKRYVDKW